MEFIDEVLSSSFGEWSLEDRMEMLMFQHEAMGGLTAWYNYYGLIDPNDTTGFRRHAYAELEVAAMNRQILISHLTDHLGDDLLIDLLNHCLELFHLQYDRVLNGMPH